MPLVAMLFLETFMQIQPVGKNVLFGLISSESANKPVCVARILLMPLQHPIVAFVFAHF